MIKDIATLSKNLINIPSTAGNKEALEKVLKVAKEELKKFPLEQFEKNGIPSLLIANCAEKRKFKLILNAHLDVVPGNPEQFKTFEKNGRLYGRGAYDMKAAAATMILLFRELAGLVKYPLALQLVTDEEIGGDNGTKYQIDKGVRGDFVIAGENTGLQINNKAKGLLWIKLNVKGKAAHGAYPWLGDNALIKLSKILDRILKAYPIPKKPSWQTTISLAKIETTNNTFNRIPDNATAYLDIRYIPEDKEVIHEKIRNLISNDVDIETSQSQPSQYTPENNIYIKQFKEQVSIYTKKEPKMFYVHGSSDVRYYEQIGIPTMCFGPIGEGHHADNEFVDLKSLEDYYHILKNFILSLN